MPRDYKSRADSPQPKRQASGWIWFSGGLMLGLFVSFLVWLKLSPGGGAMQHKKVTAVTQSQERAETDAPKPRFDFYTILPEMEVVVPEPEPEPAAPKDPHSTEQPALPQQETDEYMLQMGSFRKYADADRLKASLALVGLEAEIQRVTIKGGEVFHRVRSGPYTRGQVNTLRARLKANNINSLVIKQRN